MPAKRRARKRGRTERSTAGLLTQQQAADLVNRSKNAIRLWRKAGRLNAVAGHSRLLYRPSDVQAALRLSRYAPHPQGLLTATQAGQLVGKHSQAICRLHRVGKLPAAQTTPRLLFTEEAVRNALAAAELSDDEITLGNLVHRIHAAPYGPTYQRIQRLLAAGTIPSERRILPDRRGFRREQFVVRKEHLPAIVRLLSR
jgi:hypothetical protein